VVVGSSLVKIYQVDAFTSRVFEGNPAAVVPLEKWVDDTLLQAIAAENNLAETAFTVPNSNGWEIRWFTPTAEVALCGHATLAAAYVLVKHHGFTGALLRFQTRQSGEITVERRENDLLAMSFPAIALQQSDQVEKITDALGVKPDQVLFGRYSPDQIDYVAIFNSEDSVKSLTPHLAKFTQLESRGIIATAPSTSFDFVSRYFAPCFGIDEDPVTGSAHCLLTPYWANVLGKQSMQARQISSRGGDITCTMANNDRVILAGYAVDYLIGELII